MPKLSILIPSLVERLDYSDKTSLFKRLKEQIDAIREPGDVELLSILDNRNLPTGRKRQLLLDMSQGLYVTCLDDDDLISSDYLSSILKVIGAGERPDVIVFDSLASLDGGNTFTVTPSIKNKNEQCRKEDGRWVDITRMPWHWCVWRREIAVQSSFPDQGYIDDDWYWLKDLMPLVKTEARIDRVLHYYQYNSEVSASNQGETTT